MLKQQLSRRAALAAVSRGTLGLAAGAALAAGTASTAAAAEPPAKRSMVTLDIYTSVVVFGPEVEALRRLVNQRSSWLRLQVQDVKAAQEAWNVYVNAAPEDRKKMIVWDNETGVTLSDLGVQVGFTGKLHPQPMPLLKLGPLTGGPIGTLNPNIKTFRDLVGKTLNHGAILSADFLDMEKALGLEDKIKNVALGSDDVQTRALMDGIIDAIPVYPTGPTRLSPLQAQLMQERKFYFVDLKEAAEALHRFLPNKWPLAFPWPFYQGTLPPVYHLDYDPIRSPVVYGISGRNPQYYVSPEMDHDVAYELVSTAVKYRDDFDKLLTRDVQGVKNGLGLTLWSKRDYHPGARQAYTDTKWPFGLAASIQSERQRAAASHQPYYLSDYMQKLVAADK